MIAATERIRELAFRGIGELYTANLLLQEEIQRLGDEVVRLKEELAAKEGKSDGA